MSLGPFDALFAFLSGVTGGDLHIAALLVLLLLIVALESGFRLGRFVSTRHVPDDGETSSVNFGLAVLLLGKWTLAIILILDIDRPQSGQVRVDPAPLIWTLQGFGPGT